MNTAQNILDWLEASGRPEVADGLSRFGIPNETAYGVAMGEMQKKAKSLGPDHDAASVLWETGRYEARIMAVLLADPDRLTAAQADLWCAEFDNWAICDTACFALFDRAAFRWEKVPIWCADDREFVRRAGFALIWAMSTHDKTAGDEKFRDGLVLMDNHADDTRPLVRKAIDMALRATGKRNSALHDAACDLCRRLVGREEASAAWIGRHALKELESDKVMARLQRRGR